MKSNDARALLSRGAADGFAEVEFQGSDGKRYRATWKVHRARNLGKFQDQTMALVDLDSGDIISSRITEVRQAVATRVGFSFEEFKRTVLLPQLEFTNFLRARSDDRAQILEYVMGGAIFTKLSVAAHERATSEREKLIRLQDKLGTLMTLSEDDRAQLDGSAAAADEALSLARTSMEEVGLDLAWHERQADLVAGVESAGIALSEAEQRVALAEPLEKEIQAVSAAQPFRAARDEANRTAAAQGKAKDALGGIRHEIEQTTLDLEKARQAFGEAESELRTAREREASLRPRIDEAKQLDLQMGLARRTAAVARTKLAELRDQVEHDRGEQDKLAKKISERETECSEMERWLATHSGESQLSAEWPRWQAELRKHAAVGQRLATIAERLATAKDEVARVVRERTKAAGAASEAEGLLTTAQKRWEETEAALGGRDLADLRARTSERRKDLDELAAVAELVERARSAQETSSTARAQAAEFRADEERWRLEVARLAGELDGCRSRMAEARLAAETTRAALSFDQQRSLLKDGQACPLCGSTDHPYAHAGLSSIAMEVLEQRVVELDRLSLDLQGSRSTAEAEQAVACTKAYSAERAANEQVAAAEEVQRDYLNRVASLALDLPTSAATASAAVTARVTQAQARYDLADSDERRALGLASERDRARGRVDDARSTWGAAVKTHAGCVKQEQEMTTAVGRLIEDQGRLTGERNGIETLLTPVMGWHPDWGVAARESPDLFLEVCQSRAQEFETYQQRLATALESLAAMRAGCETALAVLGERQANLETSITALREQDGALSALETQRAALLEGRGTLDIETELKTRMERATSRCETARNCHTQATTSLAVARAAEEAADRNLHEVDQDAAQAGLALDLALAGLGVDRPTLEERLAHDETWIAEQRKCLEALREEVARALATRNDRLRSLGEHAGKGRPKCDYEATRDLAAKARIQVDELGPKLIGLRAKQQHDDELRAGRSSAQVEVRAQEEASKVWEQLDEVVGSADGKKFRVFAQSLAFEALLREANAHLGDLAPRYRLMSVPGAGLELQVADQDLGSEVRTINSLSGGETFLVSLALALALSGISTRATQAQTLFIDEGFGTLDRETLDHAMVALENLQATGRTVGIISHVPELRERFGAQVRVEPVGCGRSRVRVAGP